MSAWTTGGNLADAVVQLAANPSSVPPEFSFGCGSDDGTDSCDLGAIDSTSAQRQLQAESTVPTTASTITSVKLTVIGSAAGLSKDPSSSATVQISGTVAASSSATPSSSTTPSSSPSATASATPSISPLTTTSPLPVGDLPGVSAVDSPTLSPGGNAGNLFPTLQPSAGSTTPKVIKGRPVADTTALPEGASVLGASLVGLLALALAFVLAVTRFSIRRRPALTPPGTTPAAPAATAATDTPAAKPDDSAPSAATSDPAKDAPKPPEPPTTPSSTDA